MSLFLTFSIFAATPKAVVIGAGIAGLTTAYRLYQMGLNVYVYEARCRVGGSVLTVNINNKIAELGGQNISDGGEAKNLCALIDELNLELVHEKISLNNTFYFTGNEWFLENQILNNKHFDPENLKIQLYDLAHKSTI